MSVKRAHHDILVRAFKEEVKKFCAEYFEEKPGGNVLCMDLYGIYLRSKGLDEGCMRYKTLFKHYAQKTFMKQWPNCKYGRHHKHRCYLHVAVRQASAIPEPPMGLPSAPPVPPMGLPSAPPVSPVALPLAPPVPPPLVPGFKTVYILELEHGRVYVGSSRHVERRIIEHISGIGNAFTRIFKPTGRHLPRLGNLTGDGDGPERDETLRYMAKRGARLVRGWKYNQVHMSDADFNDAEANIRELGGLCRRCGHAGHFVADCRMAFDRLGMSLN